jgi:hypothetical protein
MKRRGSLYEQIFFTEALARNLEVFIPLGDYLPQDCLVMNQAGRIFRVQVKGTENFTQSGNGSKRYMITTATGTTGKQPIDPQRVDIVAAYIASIPTWYLIPTINIDNAIRISLYAHNPKSKAKHERFREDWDCFKKH